MCVSQLLESNQAKTHPISEIENFRRGFILPPSHLQSELCKMGPGSLLFQDLFDALNPPVISISPYLLWLRY